MPLRWTDVPVHVIDFEGSVRAGVVEFGVVTLVQGEIVEVATRTCRPSGEISAAETAVHGLVPGGLSEAEPFAVEWPRFARLRETGVLAAHFSATEHALLRAHWPVPRLSADFLSPGRLVAEWGPWIDTGRIALGRVPRAPGGGGAGLEDVVRACGVGTQLTAFAERWCPRERCCFHCAGYDALASALVLQALARDDTNEPWTLARVLAESTANVRTRDAHQQARWF